MFKDSTLSPLTCDDGTTGADVIADENIKANFESLLDACECNLAHAKKKSKKFKRKYESALNSFSDSENKFKNKAKRWKKAVQSCKKEKKHLVQKISQLESEIACLKQEHAALSREAAKNADEAARFEELQYWANFHSELVACHGDMTALTEKQMRRALRISGHNIAGNLPYSIHKLVEGSASFERSADDALWV